MDLTQKVERMNGIVMRYYTLATTHVVANKILTDKCHTAYKSGIPVMVADWIHNVWDTSQRDLIDGTNECFTKYSCPIFYNLNICVSQLTNAKKNAIKNIIDNHGIHSHEAMLVIS